MGKNKKEENGEEKGKKEKKIIDVRGCRAFKRPL